MMVIDNIKQFLLNPPKDISDPKMYLNRELSWLQFNDRVLEEALDESHPLLERLKFLAIFSSNLDEFFMIRVSGLRKQMEASAHKTPPNGLLPSEQILMIRQQLQPKLEEQYDCWKNDFLPKLKKQGIKILRYNQLKRKQRKILRSYFKKEIYPALTPLAFDPGHPFPHISNLSMNLAVVVHDPKHGQRFARLKVPKIYSRLIAIPSEETADEFQELGLDDRSSTIFVWVEEVVKANLDLLFPGLKIEAAYPFRVTRDADPEIEEDEASDLLSAIEESVRVRQFGSAIRLEIDNTMPDQVRDILQTNLDVASYQIYVVDGPIGLSDAMELMGVNRPELKDKPFKPSIPPSLSTEESIISVIRRKNVLLYHPYDSFDPVIRFIREAARDPDVLAIKMTLYRVGPDSPIVAALMDARENGKQVAVLVELKARFDEENNIVWAKALERAGVHVVYGLIGLKTHAKVSVVIRHESDGIRRYIHMATGNYNAVTARLYSDIGYFTCNSAIGKDVSALFNGITGYSRDEEYKKILVAPGDMQKGIISRIEREIKAHQESGDGYLAFKMNSLVDNHCIRALYKASQAGVKIDIQARGICCLRPGVKGISDNISVTSIVSRFLEHSRIYYFRNGGNEEILLGSADLMPRNLYRRVETLFPVEDESIKIAIRDEILNVHLGDNVKARRMLPDGSYERVMPAENEEPLDSQEWMIKNRGVWHHAE
ncbi:MAG: polyphosphate kinase 1 [Anaerolineales bacterium]|nr:polyphosphate kinase 1 [Anaerolineales bacterium]